MKQWFLNLLMSNFHKYRDFSPCNPEKYKHIIASESYQSGFYRRVVDLISHHIKLSAYFAMPLISIYLPLQPTKNNRDYLYDKEKRGKGTYYIYSTYTAAQSLIWLEFGVPAKAFRAPKTSVHFASSTSLLICRFKDVLQNVFDILCNVSFFARGDKLHCSPTKIKE